MLQKYYYALPIITRQLTFGLWDASPVNFTQRGHFSQVYTINTVCQNKHFGLESCKHKNETLVSVCLYCIRCGLTFPERLCNSSCRNSLKSKQGWYGLDHILVRITKKRLLMILQVPLKSTSSTKWLQFWELRDAMIGQKALA